MQATTENIARQFVTTTPEDLEEMRRIVLEYYTVMAILRSTNLSDRTLRKCSKAMARKLGISKDSILIKPIKQGSPPT